MTFHTASVVLATLLLAAAVVIAERGPAAPPAVSSYRAASVVHTPINIDRNHTIPEMITDNLAMYGSYVQNASGADIIVFPESGTGYLQAPPQYILYFCEMGPKLGWSMSDAECALANLSTTKIPHSTFASCTARKSNMYMLINFCEATPNANVSYNLNVVFDRAGKVVARYRKSHITGTGKYLSQPINPDPSTFTADFGVTFGIFTCYDFWFSQPEQYDMVQGGASAFLFPAEMASGAPYYLVIGAISGWAMSNRVDVISAGSLANGGSGVFQQGVAKCLNHPIPGMGESHQLCVASLNVDSSKARSDAEAMNRNKAQLFVAMQQTQNSQQQRVETIDARGSGDKCFYGPSQFPRLHFPMGCAKFTPTAGTKYQLQSSWTSPNVSFPLTIECEATVSVQTTSATNWILMAMVLASNPTAGTPSSTWIATCMLTHCSNTSSCMSDDPAVGYGSDWKAASVFVSAKISGIAPSKIWPYPVMMTTNGIVSPLTSYRAQPVSPAGITYVRGNANNNYTYSMAANQASSPEFQHNKYLTGGLWFSNRYKNLY